MTEKSIDWIHSYFKPPFKYDKRWINVRDANMEHVLDIRWWGAIQYLENWAEKQDSIWEYIAELLNKDFNLPQESTYESGYQKGRDDMEREMLDNEREVNEQM